MKKTVSIVFIALVTFVSDTSSQTLESSAELDGQSMEAIAKLKNELLNPNLRDDLLRQENGILSPMQRMLPTQAANPILEVKLRVPSFYPDETQEEIKSLFSKIQSMCPECSTGGTIGGPVVFGPNAPGGTGPLFPTSPDQGDDCAEETATEIAMLRLKAAMYDEMIKSGDK